MPLISSRFAFGLSLAALLVAASTRLCANEGIETLKVKHGLVPLGERLWVLPLEINLRGKLVELPKQREQLVVAEKNLDGAVERNARAWEQTRPAVSVLKQSLARLSSADPQRELIARQIKSLEGTARQPRRLGSRGDVRSLVIELTSARCELLAGIAWIRESVPQLLDQYLSLAGDAELARSLAEAGDNQRLGPQRTYKADLERLDDYERLAATPWLPTFQQGGQTRFAALVDERVAVTFSWINDEGQPLVLTASAAEAAGLKMPVGAVRETIRAMPDREVTATRITLGYLRLGNCVLRGVRAYVLPPEAEDVGNRMSSSSLAGHRVRFEPQRLRMWIDAGR